MLSYYPTNIIKSFFLEIFEGSPFPWQFLKMSFSFVSQHVFQWIGSWQYIFSKRKYEYKLVVAQTVKHLPTMLETWVRSLGWENPLEKAMAPHSSTLAWKIRWTEEPGRLQSMGSQRVRHDWTTSLSLYHHRKSKQMHFNRRKVGKETYSYKVCLQTFWQS